MPFPSQAAAQIAGARGSSGRPVTSSGNNGSDIVLQPSMITRLAEARDLTIDDYRVEQVPLYVTISSTVTSATSTFNVPPDQNFMITEMRGLFAFQLLSQEALSIATLGNPTVQDRVYIKANNTKIDLQIQNNSLKIIDNTSNILSSMLAELGCPPYRWDGFPHPVPAGSQLLLSVSVYDTTASIIGQAYSAGVVLTGYLVRISR